MSLPAAAYGVPMDGGVRVFKLVGLSRTDWADLIHQHPTEDPRWRYDADTLHPALLKACTVDPIIDLELAGQLVDDPDVGGDLIEGCLRLTEPGGLEWAHRRLAKDARLVDEVGLCVRMGIPHEAFTSWPVTSQDLALAWQEQQTQVCPGCGVPEADMQKPRAWDVTARECWYCGELEQDREQIPEDARGRIHLRLERPPVGDS